MGTGVELATGWVRLVPSIEGVQQSIAEQFGKGAEAADAEGDKAGKRFGGSLTRAIGTAAVVGGVVAAFKGLYEVGNTFDAVADTIRVGTGATGDALEGLIDVAKNVGTSVPTDFETAGKTVSDLNTRLGLSGDTLQTVASQYLEAGRILEQEVDINATSAAFSAFRIEGEAVSGAMDTLFQVSQATGVGMNELASGAQTVAPAMQTLGFSFEDTVAMVGSFDKAGLNSQAIMASMSKGMVTLAKDGEQPAEAYKRVVGELQGFVNTGDKASALDLASQVFGTKGAAQFVGALEAGVLNMDDLMASTGATGDTIMGVGAETQDFAEKWQITMNQATEAIEPLATAIFTGLGDAMTDLSPILQDFGSWVSENPEMIKMFAIVVGILAAAFVALSVAMWAASLTPIGLLIAAIVIGVGLLIAAIIMLVQNWDQVVAWLMGVWSGFVGWFTGVMDGFLGWWNGLWTSIWEWFTGIWNGLVAAGANLLTMLLLGMQIVGDSIVAWWNGLWSAIGSFLSGIWNGIVSFVTGYINMVAAIIVAVVTTISGIWNSIWSGISSFFIGIWNNIIAAVGMFQGAFSAAFSGVSSVVAGAFEGVAGIVKGAINGVIGIINGAIDGINVMIGVANNIPGVEIPLLGSIPELASGGIVSARAGGIPAIIGEGRYDEAVIPLSPAFMESLGGGGGNAREINQTNNYYDRKEDPRVLMRESNRLLEQQMAG